MTSSVDTLTSAMVKELLYEKYILILGDSVVRGLYKDLIKFYNSDELISEDELRVKGENRFSGDRLISGGVQKGLTNGLDYTEVREFSAGGRLRIRFYFLTRCYSSYTKDVVFNDIKNQVIKPDIIIMNSCLWDISRYGIYAMRSYQRNIDTIMGSLREIAPDALVLWLSALPVSNSSKGGAIVPSAEYIRPILPGLIRDGNHHCSQMSSIHDVLYIDFHTVFCTMLHLRRPDGIHWNAIGNRLMNEIILNHIRAYYHGVSVFACPILREELENKIDALKQRTAKHRLHHAATNYSDSDILDVSEDSSDRGILSNLKRKRNGDDGDDEKENFGLHRKVIIRAAADENRPRTITLTESTREAEMKRHHLLINQVEKFDHDFCDVMFDNEFEGLNLLHYSSHDVEESEHIEGLPLSHQILHIKHEPTMGHCPAANMTSSPKSIISKPLAILYDEKPNTHEADYIILSSDDEDEPDIYSSPCATVPLPIYLLNRLGSL